jgi:hypothetical protein
MTFEPPSLNQSSIWKQEMKLYINGYSKPVTCRVSQSYATSVMAYVKEPQMYMPLNSA